MPQFPATLQNGRILVRAPRGEWEAWDPAASRIDGRRKSGSYGWSFPATLRVARQLREEFGEGLMMDDKLWSWGKHQRYREERMNFLARSLEAEVPVLKQRVPRFYAKRLRGDQRAGIAWLNAGTEDGGVILGDKAGLGKTRQYIGWAMSRPDPTGDHLIIAPRLSLRATWLRELSLLREDLGDDVDVFLPGSYDAGKKRDRELARWIESEAQYRFVCVISRMLDYWEDEETGERLCSYPDLFAYQWNTVAVDESHKMLGALTVKKGPRYARGLLELDVPTTGRLPMSGTPFGKGGRAKGMFGAHFWMRPEEYTSLWRWAERRLDVTTEEFYIKGGRGQKNEAKRIGGINEAYWPKWSRELDTLMLRRTKEEVGLNLPPIVSIDFLVPLSTEEERAYQKLEADASLTIDGGRVMPVNVLSEMLRLKQFAGTSWRVVGEEMQACLPSSKFDAVLELLSERGIDADWEPGGEKVVIGSQFVSTLEMISRELLRLGIGSYLITGSPTEEHDRYVEMFQHRGGAPVLLMTLQKGTSIDLDRADTVVLYDLLWNPEDNGQFIDRCQRSRPTPLTAVRLIAEDTVEHYIVETNADKEDIQHRILDGRRGIEFAKKILARRKAR